MTASRGIVAIKPGESGRKPMRSPAARLLLCLAATGLAAGCSTASSTSSGPALSDVDKSFLRGITSYDQNRDGAVTCDEWRAAAAGLFAKANRSGSGAMTDAEFANLASTDRTFLVANFKYYDANGDGKVDRKEFVERPNPAFGYADKDGDCRLSEPELLTVRNLSAPPADTAAPRRGVVGTSAPSGSSAAPGGISRY
jgi:Ca2+-binding EF-hand superfamily protein